MQKEIIIETPQERDHRLTEDAYGRLEAREAREGFAVRPHTPRLQLKGRLVIDRVSENMTTYKWEDAK